MSADRMSRQQRHEAGRIRKDRRIARTMKGARP